MMNHSRLKFNSPKTSASYNTLCEGMTYLTVRHNNVSSTSDILPFLCKFRRVMNALVAKIHLRVYIATRPVHGIQFDVRDVSDSVCRVLPRSNDHSTSQGYTSTPTCSHSCRSAIGYPWI